MDKRKKLSDASIAEIQALLNDGANVKSVASRFGISSTHAYRIQAAMRNGEVKLKRSSLDSCLELIKTGLPFTRKCWQCWYYYDLENRWFVRAYSCPEGIMETIVYTLDLGLDDLLSKDWIVLTWESVK
jgi:hypothetical protein